MTVPPGMSTTHWVGASGPRRRAVARAAAEGAVGVTHLEDLGEGRLEERGRHADQGHDPHPEDRAGTAHEEGRGHAEDVADADAGCFTLQGGAQTTLLKLYAAAANNTLIASPLTPL